MHILKWQDLWMVDGDKKCNKSIHRTKLKREIIENIKISSKNKCLMIRIEFHQLIFWILVVGIYSHDISRLQYATRSIDGRWPYWETIGNRWFQCSTENWYSNDKKTQLSTAKSCFSKCGISVTSKWRLVHRNCGIGKKWKCI